MTTHHEAAADAWASHDHPCQLTGHHFPRSYDTNESLACAGCGLHPDDWEEDEQIDYSAVEPDRTEEMEAEEEWLPPSPPSPTERAAP